MPHMLSCPRGHQWEASDSAPTTDVPCPVCGTLGGATPDVSAAHDSTAFNTADTPLPAEPVRPSLPDFQIVGELGRGGMGIVWKAKQLSRDRLVALKVIRKDRLVHEDAVRRFRREAQATARLAHPNIVLVFGFDQSGDTHYLVMEYVSGVTLERLVEKIGPLPVAQATDYIRQAALGLQHAYEQSLVHRDVKPANLMVTWPGARPGDMPPPGTGLVKILDMGVARLYAQAPGESLTTLTQGGVVIGTADFIAPEQLEDPHGADIRADLYSLGCTFYYLLTGQVPFPGGNLIQKLDRQRWETPPAVDQLRSQVPASIVAVVRKLMAKRPGERYATPGAVAEELATLARSSFAATAVPARTVKELRVLKGHTGGVLAVALSADGQRAVSGAKDRTLRLWDLASGKDVSKFPPQGQDVLAVAFAPSGEHVLASQGVSIRRWETATGHEAGRFIGHTNAVRSLALSLDGSRVLSASDDKTARVWDSATTREIARFARHTAEVTSLAVSRDGQRAVSAGRDATLRWWDVANGKELRTVPVPRGLVYHVALSPDGRTVLSAHFDTFLRLWDVDTGQELRRFQGHKQIVTAGLFTPDGQRILSASQDHTVRLWDVDSGCEIACFTGHTAGVTCLALTADGRFALSGSADQTLRLWALPE